ncbi:alpha/beta fold hydrolase [Streptomyces odontomachi]|uniref:alpha/beta fold hydrolase n=1 Tax=Streptomyces odontomachi TaxID=2944940 RepID=UPI002109E18A|nr:alpha/beta fold hydrolase [Streptomyces sp. ODS25]
MAKVHHRSATVQGRQLFYREAGPADAPAFVLLHGFPTSSFMYRHLIPALADRYHLIAPDYLGFGFSDAPSVDEFDYTFDALTDLTADLLDQLGVARYALYVQDYGAPVGWRLALRNPDAVTAVVSQSGNAYEEGFVPEFWEPIFTYQREQTPESAEALGPALGLDMIKWQYVTGVPDATLVDPDTWHHDHQMVSRPGNDRVQLKLLLDYASNRPLYPTVQAYLREHRPPLLAVWGRNDPIFGPDGARAFTRDQPDAEVHLLDGGHFLLESALDEVTGLIRTFLGKHLKGA